MKTWRIAGISFDHMHMGDLLRQVCEHPRAELVGLADDNPENAATIADTCARLGIAAGQVHADAVACVRATRPDIVILCPATARHAAVVEAVAPLGVHVFVEKPFASSLAEADRMIAAMEGTGKQMVVNWPLAWLPSHLTAKRLADEGVIGEIHEVRYYDGNRGPTHHLMDKVAVSEEEAERRIHTTWWYRPDQGGGSLLDYLGYGSTLGTWFHNGRVPEEVTTTTWSRPGIAVDEHSITICRYDCGLSKYETRWGTFTDPWIHQPQPRTGFVLVGSKGTLTSDDYACHVRVQTRERPEGFDVAADPGKPGWRGPIEHFIEVLESGIPLHGPLSIPICRSGQRIVDAARLSASLQRPVRLDEFP